MNLVMPNAHRAEVPCQIGKDIKTKEEKMPYIQFGGVMQGFQAQMDH